jgi:type I restriction enzyme R subunit
MRLRKMKRTRKAKIDGFTGTPIEKTGANTRAVFGDYISI